MVEGVGSVESLLPICRYCHEVESVSSGVLVRPCECSGSLAFAHSVCLCRWVCVQMEVVLETEGVEVSVEELICEICLSPYVLSPSLQKAFVKKKLVGGRERVRRRETVCWILLVVLTVSLLCLVGLIFGISDMDNVLTSGKTVAVSIWLSFAAIWFIAFFIGCYHMYRHRSLFHSSTTATAAAAAVEEQIQVATSNSIQSSTEMLPPQSMSNFNSYTNNDNTHSAQNNQCVTNGGTVIVRWV